MKQNLLKSRPLWAMAIVLFVLGGCGGGGGGGVAGVDNNKPVGLTSGDAANLNVETTPDTLTSEPRRLKSSDAPILFVETTTDTLNQIKALYSSRYYSTSFGLQAGMFYQVPQVSIMYPVDSNPLDQFVAVDNSRLPTGVDFIYPSLVVSYNSGSGSPGTSYLTCENADGNKFMLDPTKITPGNSSTYIKYTAAYIKSAPPFSLYVTSCTCTGPACLWQSSSQSS